MLALGLLAASALLLLDHRATMRGAAMDNAEAMAAMVAEYASAPLVFQDHDGASTMLARLSANPAVVGGAVFDDKGDVFATYGDALGQDELCLRGSTSLSAGIVLTHRPVMLRGHEVGVLCLRVSIEDVERRIANLAYEVAATSLILLALCGTLALRLLRSITKPISALTEATRKISREGGLHQRVRHATDDEIGTLYRGFNDMLDQIESRGEERDRVRANLQALVDALPDLIFIFAEDGTYMDAMVSETALLAAPRSEVLGKHVSEVLPRHLATRVVQGIAETLSTEQPVQIDYELLLGGTDHAFEAMFTPLPTVKAGDARRVLVVSRDVTERRSLEAQFRESQKLEAIGQLAGGIAHDFNNLLAAMLGNAEILKVKHPGSEEAQNIIEISNRAADLIKQLLAFSRRSHAAHTTVDINDLVESVAGILEHSVNRLIKVHTELSPRSGMVHGDRAQLESAILNLGINARDAISGVGKITLSTRLIEIEEPSDFEYGLQLKAGPHIEITVDDTGGGIDPDIQDRIFDPFFTTKAQGSGTGLGLAAVYGTVQSHQGRVEYESHAEHGTTFRVLLPETAERSPGTISAPSDELQAQGRVLIVDDEVQVVGVMKSLLEHAGYEVTSFTDPMLAVDYVAENRQLAGVAIVDMVMPGMGGIEVAQKFEEMAPGIVVLIASGYFMSTESERSPIRDRLFIQKPFTRDELLGIVAEAFLQGSAAQGASSRSP